MTSLLKIVAMTMTLVLCICARAGGANFQIETWTTERGLPDSSVTAITQTPDGYLWVGTYNGLARFDGINFVTFDPENTPALAHARVRQLFLDRQGALWINTFDGSLTRMQGGQFYREWTAKVQNDRDNTLVSSTSNSIAFVLDGGEIYKKDLSVPPGSGWSQIALPNRNLLTIQTSTGDCLAWFNGQTERSWVKRMWRLEQNHFQPMGEVVALQGRRIRHIAPVEACQFWLGSDAGLYFWDGKMFYDATPTNTAGTMDFSFICSATDGGLWAIANGSLVKLSNRQLKFQVLELEKSFARLGPRFDMNPDSAGGVWLHDTARGIIHVAADGMVTRLKTDANGLNDRVTSFFADREGNWWAGFELAGLTRIREARFQQPSLAGDDRSRSVRSVCSTAAGNVWIGSTGGGLIGTGYNGVTNFSFTGDAPRGAVACCCADSKGRLWVSAAGENLMVGQNGIFAAANPPVHSVKAILAGHSSGKIWAGTRSGLFMSEDGRMPFYPVAEMSSKAVRALAEDINGDLWCGDDDGTLYRLADETVEAFRPEENAHGRAIWSLLPETGGTIWVGTFRGGLLRFKHGKFFHYTSAQGLPDNVISQILSDHAGNLWLGTHRGVYRASLHSLDEVADGTRPMVDGILFGRSDGLPSLECSGGYNPAAWRTADGTLWFTTLKGAVSIQPQEVQLNSHPPAVLIEQVLAEGNPIWPLQTNAQPEKANTPLQIAPGRGQVELHFAGLSLSAPERVKYRYQLVGEDKDWVDADARRFVHYASLRPGKYSFRVTACSGDGVWNPEPAEFSFVVLPHYYQTWWFYTQMTALIIWSAFAVARHRFKLKLRRKTEQLERRHEIERERARIAKDIHDDLGSSLSLIAVMGDLARQDQDGDRIGKISSTARQAVKSLDEIVWAVNPRNDSLAQLVEYVCGYAADYLAAANIRCRLDVPDQIPPAELSSKIRHHVYLAVKEALQNIVKHSQANAAGLTVHIKNDRVKIFVTDNGRGFTMEPDNAVADGLRNLRQRMSDIGGQCQVATQPGGGTEVRLEFSLPFAS